MSATKSCRTFLPPPTPARPWFAGPGVCRFALAVMLAGLWLGMGTPVLAQPSVCDWAQCPDAEPGPVQNLVVSTTDTSDSITVTWDPPDTGGRPAGYIVYAGPNTPGRGGGKTKKPRNLDKTSVTFKNMTPGKIYKVQVRAQNIIGKGTWSRATIRLNSSVLPDPVRNLNVIADMSGMAIVSWDAPVTGGHPWTYIVHLKRKGVSGTGKTKTPRAKASPTIMTFYELDSGEYKVWVRAKNKGGKGERVEATFTVP